MHLRSNTIPQRERSILGVRLALVIALLLCGSGVSSVGAEDLGGVIASEAERRGDLESLRREWWQALQSDPDSLLASAILSRWRSALARSGPNASFTTRRPPCWSPRET